MTDNVYIIDTSTIIDLFQNHPVDIYINFWEKLNERLDMLLKYGRLRILHYVNNEVIHTAGKKEDGSDDPAVMWLKKRKQYIINLEGDLSVYQKVMEILEKFPRSADTEKLPPVADPFLIAYVLVQNNQMSITGAKGNFCIVTQEKRNKNQDIEKLRKRDGVIVELTKIRSICNYIVLTLWIIARCLGQNAGRSNTHQNIHLFPAPFTNPRIFSIVS